MWGKVFEILKRIFTINDELKKLQADSNLHSEQIREIVSSQTRFFYEYQLQRERDAVERERELHKRERALAEHEQEKLRLENQQLRERLERLEHLSLPSPASKPPDEPSKD
jgi:hypothetical protein